MAHSRKTSAAIVRLRDIAQMAGVSVNTVSRALNDRPDVSPETRERVRSIARGVGYSPNLLAKSLVSGLTHTVGLVVTDCTDPYYATLIQAVEEVTDREGFGLLLATSNEDPAKEKRGLSLLSGRRIDGLLLTAVNVGAPHVREVLRGSLPVVLLSRRPRRYRGPFVGIDNVRAARTAVRHLCELGHRRLVLIGRSGPASSARERLVGFREELRARGLPWDDPTAVCLVAPTVAGGRGAVPWFLELDPRPTAIVAYNDAQAIGAIKGLQEAGLAVPDDISVVGFDNIAMAALFEPALTTVAQPIDEIGRLGAEILIRRIRGETEDQGAVVLPSRLIIRESVRPIHDA
jgi:LacI family transcriptional regulator